MMDEYFEKLKHEAEKNDTGLTNEVYFTDKDTVVKTYSQYPFTSLLESLTGLLNGKINYISRDERMRNEVEIKELIEDLGFGTAQVLEIGEESIEFERVPGIDGFAFLKEASEQDAMVFGQKIGDFLSKIHSQNVALNDFRLSNIHVSDSFDLYFIDHEYSKSDANSLMKKVDQLTLFSSARQTGNFNMFIQGFRESRSSVGYLPLILSVFLFGHHALLLDRDLGNFFNGIKSILNKMVYNRV